MLLAYLNRAKPLVLLLLISSIATSMTACSWLEPHRIDLTQGAILSQEKIDQLKLGMNAEQIQYLLGSPSLRTPENPTQWIYIQHTDVQHKALLRKRIDLTVVQNKLLKAESNDFNVKHLSP